MFSLTGESGVVYQVDEPAFNAPDGRARLHSCRDTNGRERIIKLYPAPLTDEQAAGSLRAAVAHAAPVVAEAEAAGTAGTTPETSINLPIDVLTDHQGVTGVVLPEIPREFLYDGRPRTFDEIADSASPPDAAFRVGLLIRVSEIFAALEGMGLVHGDVSQQNLLWRADQPDAYLINWNGMPGAAGDAASQGYLDPRLAAQQVPAPDGASDRFGLAVAMYRCLLLNPDAPVHAGQVWNPAPGVPADLDPRMRGLFDRAFGDPQAADGRPAPGEWADTLRSVFVDADGRYRLDAIGVLDHHSQRAPEGGTAVLGGAAMGGPPPPPNQPPSQPQPPYGPDPYGGYGGAGVPPQQPPYGPGGPTGPGDPYGPGGPGDPYGGGPGGPYGPGGPGPYGPGGPGGQPPRKGTNPLLIVGIIAIPVVIILIAGGAWAFGVIPGVPSPFGGPDKPIAAPTPSDSYTPYSPTYSPYSPTPYSPTYSPYSPTTDPYDDPTTDAPAPDYNYGAIAVAHNGAVGKSWDYDTAAGARSRALSECSGPGCKVLVEFVNSCGAVAYNSATNRYWGGHGSTKAAAKSNAIANAGGGRWIAWVCTTR